MTQKLQNNWSWTTAEDARLAEDVAAGGRARTVLFALVLTAGGGNEYRPCRRFADFPEHRRLFARKPGLKKPKFLEIDRDKCEIDRSEGTVLLPVTFLKVQVGPFGGPKEEPEKCPVCGGDLAACKGEHFEAGEPSEPTTPPSGEATAKESSPELRDAYAELGQSLTAAVAAVPVAEPAPLLYKKLRPKGKKPVYVELSPGEAWDGDKYVRVTDGDSHRYQQVS